MASQPASQIDSQLARQSASQKASQCLPDSTPASRTASQLAMLLVGCLPAKVAEKTSFTLLLEPYMNGTLDFVVGEQCWSEGNAETSGFTFVL